MIPVQSSREVYPIAHVMGSFPTSRYSAFLVVCLLTVLIGCSRAYMANRTAVQQTTTDGGRERVQVEYLVLDSLELSMHWHEGMPSDSVELGVRPDAHIFQWDDTGPLKARFEALSARPMDSLRLRLGTKTVRRSSAATDSVPIETTPGSSTLQAVREKPTVPRGRFRVAPSTLLGMADSATVRLTLYLGPRPDSTSASGTERRGASVVGVDEAMRHPAAVVAVEGGWRPSATGREAERIQQRIREFLSRREMLSTKMASDPFL